MTQQKGTFLAPNCSQTATSFAISLYCFQALLRSVAALFYNLPAYTHFFTCFHQRSLTFRKPRRSTTNHGTNLPERSHLLRAPLHRGRQRSAAFVRRTLRNASLGLVQHCQTGLHASHWMAITRVLCLDLRSWRVLSRQSWRYHHDNRDLHHLLQQQRCTACRYTYSCSRWRPQK
jgi:hypothetical protein